MTEVGHLAVFLNQCAQNCHLVAMSYYEHVYMLVPCTYAIVSSVCPRE